MKWIYVTECLYRKCKGGTIYIRVAGSDGRPVMRSTRETDPVKAKAFLERWRDEKKAQRYGTILTGPSVRDKMLTVNDLIDDYVKAGHPKRKMQPKPADTVEREKRHFKPLREWWGIRNPHGINLGDCDAYKEWRLSGGFTSTYEIRGHKHTKRAPGGNRAVDIELCTLSKCFPPRSSS